MNEYRRWFAVALVAVAVAIAAGVAYNLGLSQGLAQVAGSAGSPPPYAYGWHRPWGFGFLFPLLFFAFWITLFRGFWWNRWSYRSYYGPPPVSDRFDEWHRQAHERMSRPGEASKV